MKDRFGFDMFDDVIDHSYDNEIDNSKRLFMVFNEIKKLLENKDKLIDFYKNNKNRFLNNREKVLDIYKSENDQNYFRNIVDINTLMKLRDKSEDELLEELTPFGFMDDGLDELVTIDVNGDRWLNAE